MLHRPAVQLSLRAFRGVLALTAACLLAAGCGRQPTDFNVLLITVDTLRADRVGAYGYEGADTPTMDRLARQGVLFGQAMAQVPLTNPSHACILTGSYPHVHGVRNNGNYVLAESRLTLAEMLKARGYSTGAIVSAVVLDRRYGLSQGFDVYDDDIAGRNRRAGAAPGRVPVPSELQREECRADTTTDSATRWLREHRSSKFFLWTHYYDPHDDYDPPPPYRDNYAAQPYDGEVAFVDACLGKLLAELDRLGLREKTLIVLTSDHGEGLGEHGESTHGYFNYDTTLRVPLIVTLPGTVPEGRTVAQLVRSIDIMPTVLDMLGLPPAKQAMGTSLRPRMRGRNSHPGLESYGETLAGHIAHDWCAVRSLRTGKWKYIHSTIPELYDLAADPRERHNLADRKPNVVAAMRTRLGRLLEATSSAAGSPGMVALSAEARRQLQSIGYVAGARSSAARQAEVLTPKGRDPKEVKGLIDDILAATKCSSRGEHERAATYARGILATDPDNITVQLLLIRSLLALGRRSDLDEIHQRARQAADSRPDVMEARLLLSRAAFETGDLATAIAVGEDVIAAHRGEAEPHYNLAVYYQAKGETERAETLLTTAVALDPSSYVYRNELGAHHFRARHYDRAATEFRQALALSPSYTDARVHLGMSLIYAGRIDQALAELSTAVRDEPDHALARMALGVACIRSARYDDARGHLATSVELNPANADAWYNLASAESLAGNTPAAVTALRQAIRHGGERYRALARTDGGMANLGSDPAFRELIDAPPLDGATP